MPDTHDFFRNEEERPDKVRLLKAVDDLMRLRGQQASASKGYRERMLARGYKDMKIFVPAELREELKLMVKKRVKQWERENGHEEEGED